MDSVTHVVIGAAIGDAFLRKKIGRWGMLVGAVLKSVPDFDLFYTGLADPRAYMCHHRGHTHSLIWEGLYAIPIAWLLTIIFKRKITFAQALFTSLACLWGHSLLDWCTNYGTRLLLPATNTAYSLNNMAIADLVFTLPMLVLVIFALAKKDVLKRKRFSLASLGYAFLYLGFTFFNKSKANAITKAEIANGKIAPTNYITNPCMLNNMLWYTMASNDSMVMVGEYSLLHPHQPIKWLSYARQKNLLEQHADTADIKLINWFGNPYTIARQRGDTLIVYTVKFGRTNMLETELQKTFIFHYKLYKQNGEWKMGMEEPNQENANLREGFTDLLQRINGNMQYKQ